MIPEFLTAAALAACPNQAVGAEVPYQVPDNGDQANVLRLEQPHYLAPDGRELVVQKLGQEDHSEFELLTPEEVVLINTPFSIVAVRQVGSAGSASCEIRFPLGIQIVDIEDAKQCEPALTGCLKINFRAGASSGSVQAGGFTAHAFEGRHEITAFCKEALTGHQATITELVIAGFPVDLEALITALQEQAEIGEPVTFYVSVHHNSPAGSNSQKVETAPEAIPAPHVVAEIALPPHTKLVSTDVVSCPSGQCSVTYDEESRTLVFETNTLYPGDSIVLQYLAAFFGFGVMSTEVFADSDGFEVDYDGDDDGIGSNRAYAEVLVLPDKMVFFPAVMR